MALLNMSVITGINVSLARCHLAPDHARVLGAGLVPAEQSPLLVCSRAGLLASAPSYGTQSTQREMLGSGPPAAFRWKESSREGGPGARPVRLWGLAL